MPRATKEKTEKIKEEKEEKKVASATSKVDAKKSTKKTDSSKVSEKKATSRTKSTATKAVDKAKEAKTTSKASTSKTVSTNSEEKKVTSKRQPAKRATSKKTSEKPSTTKRSTSKSTTKKGIVESITDKILNRKKKTAVAKKSVRKITSKKTMTTSSTKKKPLLVEYYDLPYRYNQTTVKILAQTPTKLFVYWELSDTDRNNYIANFGEDFFNLTKPVLIVHNLTMNYAFEVDINDFANSWYIQVNDPNCYYEIELGRRPLVFNDRIKEPYFYISSSNNLQSPNNHILFENINSNTIFKFKNVKTQDIHMRKLSDLPFLGNLDKIYNIEDFYNLYKKFYGEDLLKELADTKLNNPSSGAISAFK